MSIAFMSVACGQTVITLKPDNPLGIIKWGVKTGSLLGAGYRSPRH